MSTASPARGHRHEGGDIAHGPESMNKPTRALQIVLGLSIAGTIALLLYLVVA